ncbi:MAG: bifunctional tetrahydrofolate synthase/dihydrofolate synthase [Acidiferrobacter sp.]
MTLNDWLDHIETLHTREVDLGLTRLMPVIARLPPLAAPVITVAGTNGKGSTVAFLEAMYRAAGYRTGAYFSPHLVAYNERVRILGEEATDAELVAAFAAVEAVRAGVPLTYFEFGTLAALVLFARRALDIVVLEVGLGGRLDAVNAVDSEVAVVVSVGTDHADWLGPDREAIGAEKAGIFRAGRPAIVGPDPPDSVLKVADRVGAPLHIAGRDFRYERTPTQWRYHSARGVRDLPYPALRGAYQIDNAACAVAAVEALVARPVSGGAVRQGLVDVCLAGRFQTLPGPPLVVIDVAHNAEAGAALRATLDRQPVRGRTLAVVGMLKDKPIEATLAAVAPAIDSWYVARLGGARGAPAERLVAALAACGQRPTAVYDDVIGAYTAARAAAQAVDRVVVFGSFKTVGAILALLSGREGDDD